MRRTRRQMKRKQRRSIIAIILAAVVGLTLGMLCAVPTHAAERYAKSVAEVENPNNVYFVLEAADYPKVGYVAAPDKNGWMSLIKYSTKTAEAKHAVWMISNREQGWIDDGWGGRYLTEVTAPTVTITNHDYSAGRNYLRAVTYTKQGFYWLPEIYVDKDPLYEYLNSPSQRWTVRKVGTKDGRAVFRFYSEESKLSLAAGGWGRFCIRIVN